MATDLIVYGPIEIPVTSVAGTRKFIDEPDYQRFQELLASKGIAAKEGCYVFATRAGKGYTPWYVGKSTTGLGRECLGDHKIKLLNRHLMKGYKGTPVMFFVAPPGNGKAVSKPVCNAIETYLIQTAHAKNPYLLNKHKKSAIYWSIQGVVGDGRGRLAANTRAFKTMIGL